MKVKSCISKEKIEVIVKENRKSKKVPTFTKRQRKSEGENFQISAKC